MLLQEHVSDRNTTACPMTVSLHVPQSRKLLTLTTLLVRFTGGSRVEQVGTLSALCLKKDSCTSRLNCKKDPGHGCCLDTKQDYSLNAVWLCTCSLKSHLQWRTLCSRSHLPHHSRPPDALKQLVDASVAHWKRLFSVCI